MNVQNVKIGELTGIGCNNPKRVEGSSLATLRDSIAVRGVLQPILVDKQTRRIIDGHRRVQCATELGMDTVPVIFVLADGSSHELYAELNTAARQFNGADKLYAAAIGGIEFPGGDGTSIRRTIEIVGTERAVELSRSGNSAVLYQKAIRIGRYCGQITKDAGKRRELNSDEKMIVRHIMEWVVTHKMSRLAEMAMHEDISQSALWEAIRDDRRIEMKWG